MKKNTLLHYQTELAINNLAQAEFTDRRLSGRTKQLNLPVKPLFHSQLKILSARESRPMTAILEDALACYQEKLAKKQ